MRWVRTALSLRSKITATFTLIVVGGTVVSTLIGSRIVTDAMRDQARLRVRQGIEATRTVYQDELNDIGERVRRIAEAGLPTEAVSAGGIDALRAELAAARDAAGLTFLGWVDRSGLSVVRGLEGDPSSPPPAALSTLLAQARSGTTVVGTEVMAADALDVEHRGTAALAIIEETTGPSAPPATVVTDGLVMVAATPVTVRGRPAGVLYGGLLANGRHPLVDRVDTLLYAGERYRGLQVGTVAILLGDRWIATNVQLPSGERAVGAKLDPDIARAVIEDGGTWSGNARLAGEWYEGEVAPIRNVDGAVVGALQVAILEAPFLAARTEVMQTFLVVCLVGLVIVFVLTYLLTRTLIHPLEEMVAATKRIATGDLDATVNVTSRDELGDLAVSFNNMLASLKTVNNELSDWARTLEAKVRERTEELVAVQARMAQSEKLASIGRLAAGVAHGLNNPLGGILAVTMLALEDRPQDDTLRADLDLIVKQTLRCREIVKGLLDFSRQSDARVTETDVTTVVESSLALLERQAIFQNIRTVRRLEPGLPPVLIDPIQLQEVVLNIVLNGVDAMDENGTLTVESALDTAAGEVVIRIRDTGKGVPPDVMPLLFEPFFTTKKVGKGTGLGLAIVHGIVSRAGGRVEVDSAPGQTTFAIRLPVVRPLSVEPAAVTQTVAN
jgi:two-component system, NtrC family, sensor kinase